VAQAIKALGLRVADSQTNFLFFECFYLTLFLRIK
jgi:hypothetical protein